MASGNLARDLKRWKKARAGSIWLWRGSRKADADALRMLRKEIIDECLKVVRQHKAQAAKKDYVPSGVLLTDLAEAIEKLKD